MEKNNDKDKGYGLYFVWFIAIAIFFISLIGFIFVVSIKARICFAITAGIVFLMYFIKKFLKRHPRTV